MPKSQYGVVRITVAEMGLDKIIPSKRIRHRYFVEQLAGGRQLPRNRIDARDPNAALEIVIAILFDVVKGIMIEMGYGKQW